MGSRKYLVVAGSIGVGKTTLVQWLSRTYGLKAYLEPSDTNPYLVDFYADMRRWAFPSQIHFLAQKLGIHQEMMVDPETVLQDRSIFEDAEVFARLLHQMGYLDKREIATYHALYDKICNMIAPPDLLIYLHCSIRTVRKRIKLRGRPEEQEVPTRYLQRLKRLYESWLGRWDRSPVLRLDTEKLDFIGDLVHQIELRELIEQQL